MVGAVGEYVQRGTPLHADAVAEIEAIARSLVARRGAGHERLAELCVAWVLVNARPLPLEKPSYAR